MSKKGYATTAIEPSSGNIISTVNRRTKSEELILFFWSFKNDIITIKSDYRTAKSLLCAWVLGVLKKIIYDGEFFK